MNHEKLTQKILPILKNRKYQLIATILLLFGILYFSSSIRLSNWDLLTDQTTGEKIPLALDPFYFLRLSETILSEGSLGAVDPMRYPSAEVAYSSEILPNVLVMMYNVANFFGEYTIQEINVFSPVLFFMIGLILFFLLCYSLTRSKLHAIFATAFLAFVPAYLYRTMAGFSDHESLGMMFLFAALLGYSYSLAYISKHNSSYKAGALGILTGILSALAVASWGGGARFLFMVIPISFFILWIIRTRSNKTFMTRGLAFYIAFFFSMPIFGSFINGYSFFGLLNGYYLGSNGVGTPFTLLFILIDSLLIRFHQSISFVKKEKRILYSLAGVLILGLIGLVALGKNIFSLLAELWSSIFVPFGSGRVGLTVAENAQPYLVDWIAQTGPVLFWMFFIGWVLLGFAISQNLRIKKNKILFNLFWTLLICGTLFSRISSSSLMNGTNFISQLFYAGSIAVALIFFIRLYFKEKFSLQPQLILFVSLLFVTLILGRAAQRVFFLIAPFVCMSAAYVISTGWDYLTSKKIKSASYLAPSIIILFIVSLVAGSYTLITFEETISAQASFTGPSAHRQWQGAMNWVATNTPEDAIFIHWWDYGYWVQYLGERASVTDGGHAVGWWDHIIGRYLLTTPEPETALSLMKTHNASYLLLDPTDVGKYPAYSSIGSGPDGADRYSAIPVLLRDPSQTLERESGTLYAYRGTGFVDEDIIYSFEGQEVLLPYQASALIGITWEIPDSNSTPLQAPVGIYYYNNQQYAIPLRYAYSDNQLLDFGEGIEAVARVIPHVSNNAYEPQGAIIYLSPKVAKGLFAQLYLLDDAFGNYESISLAYSEPEPTVQQLKAQLPIGDIIYFQGLRGPLTIWKVEYPEETLANEEFLETTAGEYGKYDDLQFTK